MNFINDNQKANLISAGKVWLRHNYEDSVRLGKVVWDVAKPLVKDLQKNIDSLRQEIDEELDRMEKENTCSCCHCECKENNQKDNSEM